LSVAAFSLQVSEFSIARKASVAKPAAPKEKACLDAATILPQAAAPPV
jgi:hypothetical protein